MSHEFPRTFLLGFFLEIDGLSDDHIFSADPSEILPQTLSIKCVFHVTHVNQTNSFLFIAKGMFRSENE